MSGNNGSGNLKAVNGGGQDPKPQTAPRKLHCPLRHSMVPVTSRLEPGKAQMTSVFFECAGVDCAWWLPAVGCAVPVITIGFLSPINAEQLAKALAGDSTK